MENDRICSSCGRMVDKTKRFAIMVDGILQVSVPLCFPCYEDINDHVIPMLNKKGSYAVH
jgi:hypothetical protein